MPPYVQAALPTPVISALDGPMPAPAPVPAATLARTPAPAPTPALVPGLAAGPAPAPANRRASVGSAGAAGSSSSWLPDSFLVGEFALVQPGEAALLADSLVPPPLMSTRLAARIDTPTSHLFNRTGASAALRPIR